MQAASNRPYQGTRGSRHARQTTYVSRVSARASSLQFAQFPPRSLRPTHLRSHRVVAQRIGELNLPEMRKRKKCVSTERTASHGLAESVNSSFLLTREFLRREKI